MEVRKLSAAALEVDDWFILGSTLCRIIIAEPASDHRYVKIVFFADGEAKNESQTLELTRDFPVQILNQ